jgi:hypothetical protein
VKSRIEDKKMGSIETPKDLINFWKKVVVKTGKVEISQPFGFQLSPSCMHSFFIFTSLGEAMQNDVWSSSNRWVDGC